MGPSGERDSIPRSLRSPRSTGHLRDKSDSGIRRWRKVVPPPHRGGNVPRPSIPLREPVSSPTETKTDFSVHSRSTVVRFLTLPLHRRRAERGRVHRCSRADPGFGSSSCIYRVIYPFTMDSENDRPGARPLEIAGRCPAIRERRRRGPSRFVHVKRPAAEAAATLPKNPGASDPLVVAVYRLRVAQTPRRRRRSQSRPGSRRTRPWDARRRSPQAVANRASAWPASMPPFAIPLANARVHTSAVFALTVQSSAALPSTFGIWPIPITRSSASRSWIPVRTQSPFRRRRE